MPDLVSLTYQAFRYWEKTSDRDIFDFRISGQSLINENSHNSKTSNDIDIKLRPVNKLTKKTRQPHVAKL